MRARAVRRRECVHRRVAAAGRLTVAPGRPPRPGRFRSSAGKRVPSALPSAAWPGFARSGVPTEVGCLAGAIDAAALSLQRKGDSRRRDTGTEAAGVPEHPPVQRRSHHRSDHAGIGLGRGDSRPQSPRLPPQPGVRSVLRGQRRRRERNRRPGSVSQRRTTSPTGDRADASPSSAFARPRRRTVMTNLLTSPFQLDSGSSARHFPRGSCSSASTPSNDATSTTARRAPTRVWTQRPGSSRRDRVAYRSRTPP
jgi:hypothetical protein